MNVRGILSHPYRTASKIIALNILIFKFLDCRQDAEGSRWDGSKHN
jgi:hypothetical protein